MIRQDLEALRVPLIVLGVTLLAAAAFVYFSGNVFDSAKHGLTNRESELRQARQRIQNAGEEKEMISRYLAGYQHLAAVGFVGEEQRINWLDSLRMANGEARIFGVEYDIGVQRPYAYAAEYNTGQLLLQESAMHLRFRLLHEEDLPRFFESLARRSAGLYTIEQCALKRVKSGEAEKTALYQPNLTAECDLRWLTVKPNSPEKKG